MDVKSSWLSKINWTQGVTGAAVLLSWVGIDMPPEVRAAVISVISGIGLVVTWVIRTWFTTSITTASVQK